LCFFNFLAFWPFPWQRQPFRKNQHLKAQLDKPNKNGIGWTNFPAVAMETKKGGFKINLDSFHQTS
jgi:hypothetical protein